MTDKYKALREALSAVQHTGEWYYAGCGTVHDENHDEVAHPYDLAIAEHIPAIRNTAAALLAERDALREALQTLVSRIEHYSGLADEDRPNIEQWEYTEGSSDMLKARTALAHA